MKHKVITLVLALLLMLTFCVGCNNSSDNNREDIDVSIWSTSVLDKIMRDDVIKEENRRNALIDIKLAKGEVEGAQLIITNNDIIKLVNEGKTLETSMKEGKVDELTINISEIKDDSGNVIPSGDFKIYFQKYVFESEPEVGNNKLHAGFIPDMLLPYDIAVEFNENTVESINQGLYFTVETYKNTSAGEYTGTCTLNADGNEFNIPIKITVWDIELSEQVHTQSSFAIWGQDLMQGEMNCTQEMFEAYEEAILEYKCSTDSFFIRSDIYTLEEYVNRVMEASKDGRRASFGLPSAPVGGKPQYEFIKNAIKEIVKRSGDASVISKAFYYFGALIDEPEIDKEGGKFRAAQEIAVEITENEEKAIEELEQENFFVEMEAAKANEIKQAIRNIPNILTADYDDVQWGNETFGLNIKDEDFTLCPEWEEMWGDTKYSGINNIEQLKLSKAANGSVWWYTCLCGTSTVPSYQLDSDLVGARILNTMMYEYGIDGNLYWCVNFSDAEVSDQFDLDRPADSYNGDTKRGGESGEGYFLYPGTKYNSDKPFGTLRFEAIRDGVEDYEYYYYLDKLTASLSQYYDMKIDGQEMLVNIFRKLYNGVFFNPSAENFETQKQEIVNVILGCSDESRYVFKGIERIGTTATISFLVDSSFEVEVNGEALTGEKQGEGKKYSHKISMDQNSNNFTIKLKKGDYVKTIVESVGGKVRYISNFDDATIATNLFTPSSDAITLESSTEQVISGSALKATMISSFDADNLKETAGLTHKIQMQINATNIDMKKLDSIVINVYNATVDEEDNPLAITMRLLLYAKNNAGVTREFVLDNKALQPGWNSVSVSGIQLCGFSLLDKTERMCFEFYNTKNNDNKEKMPNQILYFDEFTYQNLVE